MIHQITSFKVDGCDRIFETRQEAEAQERKVKLQSWYEEHPIWASRSGDVDWSIFEAWLILNKDELLEFF